MSKHTPGPWMVAEKFNCADVRAVNGPYVASCNMSMAIDWREKEANARLIAAAPELLEEIRKRVSEAEQCSFEKWINRVCCSGDVEEVQRQWESSSDYEEFTAEWESAIALLNKATGE